MSIRRAALGIFTAALVLALSAPPSRAIEIKRMTLDNGATLLVS